MFNSLITLIEDRPVLWDKTLDIYKDKRRTFEAWREIFIILKENFEEMTSADKNEYGKSIMKNWSTLRDRWMKCHKRLKEQKSGSGTKNVRKCEYYDQMLFLTKIANPRETVSSMQTATEKSPIRSEPVPKRKKEEDTSEIDRHMANFIKTANKEEESRAMGFFKGIASIVDTFNDDEMIDFQYEVIKLVRTMKHKKNTNQRQSTETEKTDFTEFDERCYTTPSSSFAPSETPEPSFATRPGYFTKTSTFYDTENSPIYTDLSTSSHGNTYTDEFDFDFSREYPQNEDESH